MSRDHSNGVLLEAAAVENLIRRLRRPVDNPFVQGSDHVPAVWARRAEEIADWHAVLRPRRLAGEYERGRAVLGEPGIGKSVLVNRLADEAASVGDLADEH